MFVRIKTVHNHSLSFTIRYLHNSHFNSFSIYQTFVLMTWPIGLLTILIAIIHFFYIHSYIILRINLMYLLILYPVQFLGILTYSRQHFAYLHVPPIGQRSCHHITHTGMIQFQSTNFLVSILKNRKYHCRWAVLGCRMKNTYKSWNPMRCIRLD